VLRIKFSASRQFCASEIRFFAKRQTVMRQAIRHTGIIKATTEKENNNGI